MVDEELESPSESKNYLIHDHSLDSESMSELASIRGLVELDWDQRDTPPIDARVFLYLGDERIRELAPLAIERQWEIGLLPHPEAEQIGRALGVKGDLHQVFQHYQEVEPIDADILTCNEQIVFSSVVIGEVLSLRPYSANRPPTRRHLFSAALGFLKELRLSCYTLTTGKEQKIKLAALGMVAMDHTGSTLIGCSFSEALSISDGRLTLLAFAPRSILSYLWFIARLLFPKKISLSRLPASVGLIRSNLIIIEAPRGANYSQDGTLVSAKRIELCILDQRMRLLPGPALITSDIQIQSKDQVKLGHLPVEDTALQMAEVPLPLFNRAGEQDYRELFVALRDNAKPSTSYLVLMVLSVLLALTGLYANSAPVIIGAMILAPLMSPIVSLAMGLARTEFTMIRNSIQALLAGIGLGLFCSIIVAWLMPLENLTSEMQARLSPTLLDLSIAVISGVAGAYAHAKEEIAKSLAGVAIAVALVPPLSVAGIGVGWGDWSMARGAFLLLTTNLVGIALAGTLTFLVMGFAPFKLAKKGLIIATVLVAIISVPLYIAFNDLVVQGRIVKEIPTGRFKLSGDSVNLRILKVRVSNPPLVRVVLSSPNRLDEKHVDALKQLIIERIGRPILLDAQLNLRR